MPSYTYNINTDFNSLNVDISQLQKEISDIVEVSYINKTGDDIIIFFEEELSVPNKTSVDSAVSSYTYIEYVDTSSVVLCDTKPIGTNGGTLTENIWQVRDINTIIPTPVRWATLSKNQFTLDEGTYNIICEAPSYKVGVHNIRLYNVTDSISVDTGASEYSNDTSNSKISTYVTIDSTTIYQIEHYCSKTRDVVGCGVASGINEEKYCCVSINKIL
tara:strand:- start:3 stop:653 length:651 start_codon:yes stop_codon:yes gene_type:complete